MGCKNLTVYNLCDRLPARPCVLGDDMPENTSPTLQDKRALLRQSALDVSKAHGLPLYRQQLQRDCVFDTVEQYRFITHSSVDC